MKKNKLLITGVLLSVLAVYVRAIEVETVFEAVILCGNERFKPSVTQQPKNFKPYNPTFAWFTYSPGTKKNCFVGTGYQDKTYAILAIETIISRAAQLFAIAPVSTNPKIQLHLKVVSTNNKNIILTDADTATILPGFKLIGNAFDLVNQGGNVLKKQCYILAIKKKDMTQAELDAALENIFTAVTVVAGVLQG
jgi:hypothetical protein